MVTVKELEPTTWINCALIIAETIFISSSGFIAVILVLDYEILTVFMLISASIYLVSGVGLFASLYFIHSLIRNKTLSRETFDIQLMITGFSLLLLIIQVVLFWIQLTT